VKLANPPGYLSSRFLIRTYGAQRKSCSARLKNNQGNGYYQKVGPPMDEKKHNPTRKLGRHLRVPVLPDEEFEIKKNAANAGLSIAEYLRRLGLGYSIKSVLDKDNIIELSKINADLARLGGLLKLWLTNDERVSHFSNGAIKGLLARLGTTQGAMLEVVKKL
tara:strand:- start:1104 stop:1592 length:489 start_codon:yes stop_codon:yes gene_type:complete